MEALDQSLMTPRLRLEPMTTTLARVASDGPQALADALDADIDADWLANGVRMLSAIRQRPWRHTTPTRAIIIHRADERVIGDIRFEPPGGTSGVVEIGYGVAPLYRRHGYATEASARIIDWVFEDSAIEAVIAGCDMKNRASVRTLRKLGFTLDGPRRPRAFWWEMTRDQHAAAVAAR